MDADANLEPSVRYFGCDLGDLAGTETAVTALAEEVGGVDVLVNNAAFVVNKPHEEFSIAEYEEEVRVNSSAAFVLSRACSTQMKRKKCGAMRRRLQHLRRRHLARGAGRRACRAPSSIRPCRRDAGSGGAGLRPPPARHLQQDLRAVCRRPASAPARIKRGKQMLQRHAALLGAHRAAVRRAAGR